MYVPLSFPVRPVRFHKTPKVMLCGLLALTASAHRCNVDMVARLREARKIFIFASWAVRIWVSGYLNF
ncbi:hypothetical protein OAC13_01880, partial [bacterium]|nr:hypothetical protein [bacterium]